MIVCSRTGHPTDHDVATVRAFDLFLRVAAPPRGSADAPASTPARRYAVKLALWRLQWPGALDPEHRGRIPQ